jgi:NADPH-dependent 2,4-dienoyl-CoA reductase/sulfur reductase-like enzyme
MGWRQVKQQSIDPATGQTMGFYGAGNATLVDQAVANACIGWRRSIRTKHVYSWSALMKRPNVGIIGGGIAGLMAAINLHQRGIPCTV